MTSFLPTMDSVYMHRQNLEARVLMAMGGRAAEDLAYGSQEVTTGCGSEIGTVTVAR